MANIGSLAVKLVMGTSGITKSADVANNAFNKIGKNVTGMSAKLQSAARVQDDFSKSAGGSFGNAAMAAAQFGIKVAKSLADAAVALVSWGAESSIALGKTARDLGATTEGVATLQYMAKMLGGTNEDIVAGLTRLNSTLSAAEHGSYAARDAFARLGVDADKLAKMPVDMAALEIAKALGAVENATRRAALASQLFGDAAKGMLPILSLGKDSLAKFSEEAKRFGLTISAAQASAAEDAYKISKLREAIEGLARQLAVQLAPWINAVVEGLGKMGGTGGDMGKTVANAIENVARVAAKLADVVQALAQGFRYAALAGVSFSFVTADSIVNVIEAMNVLQEALGNTSFRPIAQQARAFANELLTTIADIDSRIKSAANAPWASDKLDTFLADVKRKMDAFDKSRVAQKGGGGSVAVAARNGAQFAGAAGIIDAAKTPLQAFGETLARNNALLKSGAISFDTYARSAAGAVAQLEKAHGLQDIRMAGAVRGGTSEAYSAVVQSTKEADVRVRETPQQRVERIMQQSKDIESKQLEYLREIARALQQDAVSVAILP